MTGAGIDGLALPRAVAMPHVAAPRFSVVDPVGGVKMEMNSGEWNIMRGRSGEIGSVRRRVLEGRPDRGDLSWPTK
jgi:hypothetical protein